MMMRSAYQEMRQGLAALAAALDRESSILQFVPERMFPQLFNRLLTQGGVPSLLAKAVDAAAADYRRPWLRLLNPPAQCPAPVRMYRGHAAGVRYCAFSPDGRWIASSDHGGTVVVWAAGSSELVLQFQGDDFLSPVLFHPAGDGLLTVGADHTPELRDIRTGAVIRRWTGHAEPVTALAAAPDGRLFLSADRDGAVRIHDLAAAHPGAAGAEEPVRIVRAHDRWIVTAAFHPSGAFFATGYEDGTATVWETATGRQAAAIAGDGARLTYCGFDPAGRHLVTGTSRGALRVYESTSGRLVLQRLNPECNMFSGSFSPDGARFASGGLRRLTIWETATWTMRVSLQGHGGSIEACAFSPDGRCAVSGSVDGKVALWDVTEVEIERGGDPADTPSSISDLAFDSAGDGLVTSDMDGAVRVWDGRTGRPLRILARAGPAHDPVWLTCIALSADGRWVAAGSIEAEPCVRVWDAQTGAEAACFRGHADAVNACAFSPDGRLLASADNDSIVKIWDLEAGAEQASLRGRTLSSCPNHAFDCAFSPDGDAVIAAFLDGGIRLWTVSRDATGKARIAPEAGELLRHGTAILSCAFSPDGRRIIWSDDCGWIGIIDRASGRLVRQADVHKNGSESCGFSPDGFTVVSGVWVDDVLRLSDADTLRPVALATGFTGGVKACAFSPDGERIAAGGAAGQLALFRIENAARVDPDYDRAVEAAIAEGRLASLRPESLRIPQAYIELIPLSLIRRARVLPVLLREGTLYLAAAAPPDAFTHDEILFVTGCRKIQPVIVPAGWLARLTTGHLG